MEYAVAGERKKGKHKRRFSPYKRGGALRVQK